MLSGLRAVFADDAGFGSRVPNVPRLAGFLIALCGLKLLLPLPIPMSNFFPGVAAALLAAGSFEEDGLVLVAGLLMFTVSLAYFALLVLGGVAAIGEIWQRVLGG